MLRRILTSVRLTTASTEPFTSLTTSTLQITPAFSELYNLSEIKSRDEAAMSSQPQDVPNSNFCLLDHFLISSKLLPAGDPFFQALPPSPLRNPDDQESSPTVHNFSEINSRHPRTTAVPNLLALTLITSSSPSPSLF